MPATYEYIDDFGQSRTLYGVLDPVRLSACTSVSGSNVLTVDSTTNVHPGMMVSCQGFPRGCFILSIKDANEIVLALSKWNDTTKIWETTEALANCTTAGTVAGLTAICHGHLDIPVASLQPTGTYRNEFISTTVATVWTSVAGSGVQNLASAQGANAYTDDVTTQTGNGKSRLSDRVAGTPPRHKSEPYGVWLFVCTSGHVAHIPVTPRASVIYTGST